MVSMRVWLEKGLENHFWDCVAVSRKNEMPLNAGLIISELHVNDYSKCRYIQSCILPWRATEKGSQQKLCVS